MKSFHIDIWFLSGSPVKKNYFHIDIWILSGNPVIKNSFSFSPHRADCSNVDKADGKPEHNGLSSFGKVTLFSRTFMY